MKRIDRAKYAILVLLVALSAAGTLTAGCSGGSSGPKEDVLTTLKRKYMNTPEFSIMLIDMKEEGSFSKKYSQKFKIVSVDLPAGAASGAVDVAKAMKVEETDWTPVNEASYKQLYPYLGMTVLSRKRGGEISQTAQPGGYMYVGDSRYGHWNGDTWVWTSAMMTSMYLMSTGPINRGYYNDYNRTTSSGRPYYGNNNTYGTSGSMVKNSSFFANQRARMAAKKSAFSDRARSRGGRTTTSTPGSSSSGYSGSSRPTSRTTFRSGGK